MEGDADMIEILITFEGPHTEAHRKVNELLYVYQAFLLYCLWHFEERYLSDLCFDFDEQGTVGKLLICSRRNGFQKSFWNE